MPAVGNDIVDLTDPENRGKGRDERFLLRVLTAEEGIEVCGSANPDTLLWSFWAAKEAAFKAVSREDPSVSSSPRRYRVVLEGASPADPGFAGDAGSAAGKEGAAPSPDREIVSNAGPAASERNGGILLSGRVFTPRGERALRIRITEDHVHALAAASEEILDGVVCRVDCIEAFRGAGGACREGNAADPETGPPPRRSKRAFPASPRSSGQEGADPSGFVRERLLLEISRRRGCHAGDLEIRKDAEGPGAPRVFFRDRPLDVEISLSHDGRFTAFALLPFVPHEPGRSRLLLSLADTQTLTGRI